MCGADGGERPIPAAANPVRLAQLIPSYASWVGPFRVYLAVATTGSLSSDLCLTWHLHPVLVSLPLRPRVPSSSSEDFQPV